LLRHELPSLFNELEANRSRLAQELIQLKKSGHAFENDRGVALEDLLNYLHCRKGMIIALVDFAFVPDGRPTRTVYEGHYILLL
jgi:sulfur carrier protein ThiS